MFTKLAGLALPLAALAFIPFAQATPAASCDPWHPDYAERDGHTPIAAIRRVPPVFPLAAYEAGTEGRVRALFDVLPDGSVSNIEIDLAEPYWGFRDSVRDALAQWQFEPHRIGGTATICERARFTFQFRIDQGAQ